MKIIKQPIFKPCECEMCGTLFKLEADDNDKIYLQYRETVFGIEDKTLYAICPVCGFRYVPLKQEGFIGREEG